MALAKTKKQTGAESKTSLPSHPVQFRLPPPGEVDPYFGLNRSMWNEYILPTERNNWTPLIRSRVLRNPGSRKPQTSNGHSDKIPVNVRAVRLILYASAEKFFRELDKTTAAEFEEIRTLQTPADGKRELEAA
jgi:hypothetical protein